MEASATFLLEAAARGSLVLPSFDTGGSEHFYTHNYYAIKQKESLSQARGTCFYTTVRAVRLSNDARLYDISSDSRHYLCFLRPEFRASIFTVITPDCPAALSVITGVPEDRLPWYFTHWFINQPNRGNHILSRLDPQDWVLRNPWRDLSLRVAIALSKTGFNSLRKGLGLGRKTVMERAE